MINNYIIKHKNGSNNISDYTHPYTVPENESFLWNNFNYNEDNGNYINSNNKQNKSNFLYSISDKSVNYKKLANFNNLRIIKSKSTKKISKIKSNYNYTNNTNI